MGESSLLQIPGGPLPVAGAFGPSALPAAAQTFTTPEGGLLTSLEINLRKTGSPTDNVYLSIYSYVSGDPDSGTLIQTQSLSGSSLTTSFVLQKIVFTPVWLNASVYSLVLTRDTPDDANYYGFQYNNFDPHAGGNQKLLLSGTWQDQAGNDMELEVFEWASDLVNPQTSPEYDTDNSSALEETNVSSAEYDTDVASQANSMNVSSTVEGS